MLADNQPLVSLGTQLYRLKSINKLPPLLAAYRFYAMAQEAITKASPEAISIGGGFIVAGILESLSINNN